MCGERAVVAIRTLLFVCLFVCGIFAHSFLRAQTPVVRGTISGAVIADQGEVRAFRVTAHNLQYKLWYTVYTNKGHYTIPQALPGLYDVSVIERGYSSPTLPVQLGPGESKELNLSLMKQGGAGPGAHAASVEENIEANIVSGNQSAAKTIYVDTMDEFYPPGPGRDLVRANCLGCHGTSYGTWHRNKQGWRAGISVMSETGPADDFFSIYLGRTILTGEQKDEMAEYLATNFGPDSPDKKMRIDPPEINEEAISKAIYVSYDEPADLPIAQFNTFGADMVDGMVVPTHTSVAHSSAPNPGNNILHDPFIAPDGSIWYGAPEANALVRLDQHQMDPAKRWKVFPLKGVPQVYIHGITADHEGRIYWSEIITGKLGELDPATGKQIRHFTPEPSSILQLVTDKDDNVWFGMIKGGMIGELDARTRRIHEWPTPTPDVAIYGMAADQQGNIWCASWAKGMVLKFDPKAEAFTEYKIPNSWGQIRRIGVDSKGIVWFGEYNVGLLGSLDPSTGKITEYKLPTRGSNPYETWPDKNDNIWVADQPQNSLVKFDQNAKTFTYYPEPQLNWSLPKIEVESNDTIWFGARYLPHITANHFYPNGYTADAPPEP